MRKSRKNTLASNRKANRERIARERSRAAKRGWETRRANARSRAAKKGWETRRHKERSKKAKEGWKTRRLNEALKEGKKVVHLGGLRLQYDDKGGRWVVTADTPGRKRRKGR